MSGIAIGVAAIIVLVSLVDGFTAEFDDLISSYKAITVYEKGAQDIVFSKMGASFVSKIESIPDVRVAIGEIWFIPAKIDSDDIGVNSITPPTVYGLDIPKYYAANVSGWVGEVEEGARLAGNSGDVLIGKAVSDDFKKFIGSPIKINGKNFRVKGILSGDSEFIENIIVMDIEDARSASGFPADKITSITVTLQDFSKDKKVADLIDIRYGDELQAFTQAELSAQFTGVVGNLRLLAIAVAIVSSIVAGIGIANTVLMSVLERFREIGSLKAVGWGNGDIMKMVVYESILIGIVGGVSGVLLGLIGSFIVQGFGLMSIVSPFLLLLSFSGAVLIGIIGGIYPAWIASRMDPVEALRAE